jgi:hypothetical protein
MKEKFVEMWRNRRMMGGNRTMMMVERYVCMYNVQPTSYRILYQKKQRSKIHPVHKGEDTPPGGYVPTSRVFPRVSGSHLREVPCPKTTQKEG